MDFTEQWKRCGCCPSEQNIIPAPPQNIIVFVMTGYSYRTPPVWFDSTGQEMFPLQSSVLFDKLCYRWTFYRPIGDICDNVYHFSTSDDVVPVIFEEMSNRRMKVTRFAKHNGYTNWKVTC